MSKRIWKLALAGEGMGLRQALQQQQRGLSNLHKQARTTPALRDATGSLAELAARFNVSIPTIMKGKSRDSVQDRSHTAHRLQTTLTPAQERIAVELLKEVKLGLDDQLVVVREFLNPNVSRSGLDRC